jgi:hypothetical protein
MLTHRPKRRRYGFRCMKRKGRNQQMVLHLKNWVKLKWLFFTLEYNISIHISIVNKNKFAFV